MKYFISLFILVSFIFPQQILAQAHTDPLAGTLSEPNELVSCKNGGDCNFCDLTQTINNVVRWTVFVALIIAVIILIFAGYKITASRGDVNMITDGRKLVGNVALGVFITIIAWTLIDVLMKTTTGGGFGVWNKPAECGESFTPRAADTSAIGLENKPGVIIKGGDGYDLNDPRQGQYIPESTAGGGTGGNNTSNNGNNNGFGNDPLGEYGDGTAGNPGSVYVTPNSGPQ